MQLTNEVLLGTDGWFEYGSSAPPESLDIAVSGWFDFAAADMIIVPSTSTGGERWGSDEIYHYWHRRR